jgi:hypothetical protein
MLKIGQFIPNRLSAPLRTSADVAAFLAAQGEVVVHHFDNGRNACADTASGLRLYRNGWCCESPISPTA